MNRIHDSAGQAPKDHVCPALCTWTCYQVYRTYIPVPLTGFLKIPCSILRAMRNMGKLHRGILSSKLIGRPLRMTILQEYVPLQILMLIRQAFNQEIFLRIEFKTNHNKFK